MTTSKPSKKTYAPPRLTRYGRIEAVTTGQSGAFTDGGSGMASMMGKGKGP